MKQDNELTIGLAELPRKYNLNDILELLCSTKCTRSGDMHNEGGHMLGDAALLAALMYFARRPKAEAGTIRKIIQQYMKLVKSYSY